MKVRGIIYISFTSLAAPCLKHSILSTLRDASNICPAKTLIPCTNKQDLPLVVCMDLSAPLRRKLEKSVKLALPPPAFWQSLSFAGRVVSGQ